MSAAAPARQTANEKIGRFDIVRALGRGAQGVVYLAHDPHLGRNVAIKALGIEDDSSEAARQLLDEARTISKLNHPNIVTVFDAIEHAGKHYVVLEYVEGETLQELIQREGRVQQYRAIDIARQVLDGLAYAHARGLVHRDVKPGNIMIERDRAARVMDFGIAVPARRSADFAGSPMYMAPEYLDNGVPGPEADVFSFSLVLYRMLTGRHAVDGRSPIEVMQKLASAPIEPPSRLCADIDDNLNAFVMKGLARNPDDRYPDAAAMRRALPERGAQPSGSTTDSGTSQRTLDFLLLRMRHKTNFPALSQTISTINRLASDDDNLQKLTSALLKDFSLTNKLLRLVNSPSYGQFGGRISTISRALMILGVDTVRNLAIALILLENLQDKQQASQLKEEVVATLFNGIVSRGLIAAVGGGDREEAFICGVFHNLGRLLTMYYLYDESTEIASRCHAGVPEEEAARAVLGISYEDLGIGVAKSWNLPESILQSMAHVKTRSIIKAKGPADRLCIASNIANELRDIAVIIAPDEKAHRLAELARRYASCSKLDTAQYKELIGNATTEFAHESAVLGIDQAGSRTLKTIRDWIGKETPADGAATSAAAPDASLQPEAAMEKTVTAAETAAMDAAILPAEPVRRDGDRNHALSSGIQEITDALIGAYDLNDLLRAILETMYRGIGFERVLLAMRDPRNGMVRARFGFGHDIDAAIKVFAFETGGAQDIFQLVSNKNVDIFIADTAASSVSSHIPDWYRKSLNSGAFVLMPIAIEKKNVGLLYGDRRIAGELAIGAHEMNLLKTLRNQAVLAIRQKR